MSKSAEDLRDLIKDLCYSEQEKLFGFLAKLMTQFGPQVKSRLDMKEFREGRFHSGLRCPYCNDIKVMRLLTPRLGIPRKPHSPAYCSNP
jgi:hypothetical protein